MKKTIIFLIMFFSMNVVNAATLPTRTGNYYRNTNTHDYNHVSMRGYYRNTSASKYNVAQQEYTKHNNDNHPTKFYISAKGGYNLMYGSMYIDENDNKGFTFSTNKPVFSGALGVDFNKDPSIRVELEIANVTTSKVKFDGDWDSELHSKVGYTSYMLNFIPCFKATENATFNIILGLGAASVDFTDTDHDDYLYLQSGKTAFAAKFGLGFDIPLTDNFSILPEVQYNLLVTTVKYGLANIYIGYVESEGKTFAMHNCQFMLGAKYTF